MGAASVSMIAYGIIAKSVVEAASVSTAARAPAARSAAAEASASTVGIAPAARTVLVHARTATFVGTAAIAALPRTPEPMYWYRRRWPQAGSWQTVAPAAAGRRGVVGSVAARQAARAALVRMPTSLLTDTVRQFTTRPQGPTAAHNNTPYWPGLLTPC